MQAVFQLLYGVYNITGVLHKMIQFEMYGHEEFIVCDPVKNKNKQGGVVMYAWTDLIF